MKSLCIRQRIGGNIHELYHIPDGEDWSMHRNKCVAWRIDYIDFPLNIDVSEEEKKTLYWIPR